MSKRFAGILLLLAVFAFYSLGTGFDFFYRLFYVLILLAPLGLFWAWISLRGISVELRRFTTRGQVGGFLQGQITVSNRTPLPRSWLEVVEVTDLPDSSQGKGLELGARGKRGWKIETYLSRRGKYQTGLIEVTSQDPFGLFRFRRQFHQTQDFTVLPATQPLPDLDPAFANMPNDGRAMRHWDNITTDAATVRPYNHGDSFRRIHWPYTARMNPLMVKEFEVGLAAETWVVLDLEEEVHVGADVDRVNNTEETTVSVAASLTARFQEMSVPVGLAATGYAGLNLRPTNSPEHYARLLETLAVVAARGTTSLESFIYGLRPSLNRFNTLTVITPSTRAGWATELGNLRRSGVKTRVILIDPRDYGGASSIDSVVRALVSYDVPRYVVRRGRPLNEALRSPLAWNATVQSTAQGLQDAAPAQ